MNKKTTDLFKKSKNLFLISALLLAMTLCMCANHLFADEVYLKNKDKITGEIIEENADAISVKTEAMGVIKVRREFVDNIIGLERIAKEEEPEQPEILWQREISVGYDRASGNTHSSQLATTVFINRNIKQVDEITFKGNTYYSSSERKMNAQKWYGMGRYAKSFGRYKQWYWFGRGEADHDRFANIGYRLIPAGGVGYWLWDKPELKALVEVAAGLEHTHFRDETKDTDEGILIPRGFFEMEFFGKSKITQDFYAYPMFEDFSNYRLHSETTVTSPLTDGVSLRLSLIDDYNSNPPDDIKKNDIRLMSSVVYSF